MRSLRSQDFSDNKGFTLVEMAVVAAIIGILSTIIITSFSRSRIDLTQSTTIVSAAVRQAQSEALSSTKYNNYNPCGYGVHYVDDTHVALYVGPDASTTDCSSINKNYQSNEDTIVATQAFNDNRIHFTGPFNDIFFVPPDPTTYLDNNSSLTQSPIQITVGVIGGTCPADCHTISVYPSGKIEE